jgi:hypothetical protein
MMLYKGYIPSKVPNAQFSVAISEQKMRIGQNIIVIHHVMNRGGMNGQENP